MKKQKETPKTEHEKLENQLKKALSDYQNLKKDMEKRLNFEEKIIRKNTMRSLLNIADDIDIALDRVEDEKGWRQGVSQILNKIYDVIGQVGGQMIECKVGNKFNPEVHEVIGTVSEGKEGTVVKIVQNGYRIDEMIIRPVKVIVVRKEVTS